MLEGETNFITIDRDNILETTFSELGYVKNQRLAFQVDVMTEEACDLGGPRKEWIRAMNQSIRRKYFDNGLKDFLSNDYFHVGQMIAIAMLQNGQLPNYLNEELLTIITQAGETNQCIIEMQKGLQTLVMLTVFRRRPIILHLLRPEAQKPLTVQSLLQLLEARFSEEGSNACKREKELYARFVKSEKWPNIKINKKFLSKMGKNVKKIEKLTKIALIWKIFCLRCQKAIEIKTTTIQRWPKMVLIWKMV